MSSHTPAATPRTDHFRSSGGSEAQVIRDMFDFARELERENQALRARNAALAAYAATLRKALENTELRTHSELRQAPIKGVAAALALPVPGDERKT